MSIISELFWGVFPAQLFAIMISYLSSIVNGLIVGNALPAMAMVALGFVSPFNIIVTAVSGIISGGSRVLCGQFMGKGDVRQIDRMFTLAVKLICIIGLALTAAGVVFAKPISILLGAKGDSVAYTVSYLRGISTGIVFAMLLPCLMTYLQMGNDSMFTLLLTAIMAALNAVLALVFVKVFKLGVFGAGLATSISQFASVLIAFFRFRTKNGLMHLTREKPEEGMTKKIFAFGLPTAIASILYAIRNIVLNSMSLSIGGDEAVGALAVLNSAGGPFDAFNIAVGATVAMLASLAVGERDTEFIKKLNKYAIKAGVLMALGKMLVLGLLGRPIAALFGAEGERLSLAAELLFIYSFSMPLNMIAISIMNTYTALGKLKDVNILYLFSAFVAPIGFVLALKGTMGISAVWWCYSAAEIVTLLVILLLYRIRMKSFPKNWTDLLLLDEVEPAGSSLKFNFSSLDEVSNLSKRIGDFCRENGIDERRCMLSGLCLEEMARNIIEVNFPKEKRKSRKPSIETLVMSENDEILLRIRDDGPNYNIDEINTIFNPEDPCENIGVRIVSRISREMTYNTPFGMNVLTIRL